MAKGFRSIWFKHSELSSVIHIFRIKEQNYLTISQQIQTFDQIQHLIKKFQETKNYKGT